MRVFVAVTLDDRVRTQLEAVAEQLRQTEMKASWVKPENLHVTLKFLGEIDEALLPKIQAQLDRVASGSTAFSVSLDGFDFFPPRGRARILYAATDQHRPFQQLVSCVDDALGLLGFEREQKFVPHITLARIKSSRHVSSLENVLKREETNTSFLVSGLTLFRSVLLPSGVRYDVLHQSPFKGMEFS